MIVVALIVAIVIALQLLSFLGNRKRMKTFGEVFSKFNTWQIENDSDGLVTGIHGDGNKIFEVIKNNINDYLSNSKGSVIDYNILKDSADRNIESLEDEINAQMPVPLYYGLAGTMAGVIIGLGCLLLEGSISSLMGSGSQNASEAAVAMSGAADGINDLLAGVALAMTASIFGIVLTTWNSVIFKKYKNQKESGKNKFLSWMQSVLLPKLPNDISEAFTKLVDNLNKFNGTFRENTKGLGETLDKINGAYSIQADIVESIQKMDVAKMATANVKVLKALNESTEKLEMFNYYLNSIKGYTSEIESFREQLNSEDDMVFLLKEMQQTFEGIRNFFKEEMGQINQRKEAIAESVDNVDTCITQVISKLNTSSASSIDELMITIEKRSEDLETFLKQEEKMLMEMSTNVRQEFDRQISQIPNLAKRLEDITKLPSQLEKLSSSINDANKSLVNGISQTNRDLANEIKHAFKQQEWGGGDSSSKGTLRMQLPIWLKTAIVILLIIIAGASVANTYFTYKSSFINLNSSENMPDTIVTSQPAVNSTGHQNTSAYQSLGATSHANKSN